VFAVLGLLKNTSALWTLYCGSPLIQIATLESNRTQSEVRLNVAIVSMNSDLTLWYCPTCYSFSQIDRCVGGCLLQYRNAVLSVETCRSSCV